MLYEDQEIMTPFISPASILKLEMTLLSGFEILIYRGVVENLNF